MKNRLIKLLRTLLVSFPCLQETKSVWTRRLRKFLKVPSEHDFQALSLFHDVDSLLFLDVGANVGQSADAIRMATKKAWIQMFEPNPLLCRKLEEMFKGDERIIIHNFGLGDKSTDATLYIPFYKNWMFSGHASFDEEEARNGLRDRIISFDEKFLRLHEMPSKIRRLDDLELVPFFIKLDTEGYEYRALVGGEDTIKRHEPILLIESANERIANYLGEFGYCFFAYQTGKFRSDTFGSPNTFFMTPQKRCLVEDRILT